MPPSSASRNAVGVAPSGETSPSPLITTLRVIAAYVTIDADDGSNGRQRCWLQPASRSAIGAGAAAPDLFDEIYARGKPLETTLKTLTARFTETSQSPLLARPLVARGTHRGRAAVARRDALHRARHAAP